MTRLSVLTLAALIGLAGVAQAQSSVPVDPNGFPYIGSHDWHPGPGDYTREAPGPQPPDSYSGMHHEQAMAPMERPSHSATMTDEYGFKYDARGNRIDRYGHPMSPHDPNASR